MRVLVTGSNGQLGRVFCQRLLADGCAVTGFDVAKPPEGDIETVIGSVLDLDALRQALKDKTAIVHSAALLSRYRRPPNELFEVNVQGTWNVFQVAQECSAECVVLMSSECATGLCFQRNERPPAYLPVDTEHPLAPADPYSISKLLQEEIARYYARTTNMRIVVLRPLYVIDRWDGELIDTHRQLYHPDLWGWVHPEDVALAVSAALRSDIRFEILFVGAPTTVCEESTLELVRHRFGREVEVRRPEVYQCTSNAALFDTEKLKRILGVRTRPSL